MSTAMATAAFKIGLSAIGGFVAIHKLASWFAATTWFQTKAPAWLKTGLGLVLSLIGSNAIKKAETAGQKAVDANPPKGANGPAGAPLDL